MSNFYGFLTNKGKNIFLITLLSTALLFASCINDLFNDDKSSKKQETQTEQTASEELIPVKINISNKKQIENILQNVKPQKNISQARAASPQNVALKYKILYKKVTDTSQSSCELTDSSTVLQLSKGTWDFTLIAYYNDTSDKEMVVFSGDISNKEITPGNNNSLEFTLGEIEGNGSIKITLVIPKSADYTTTVQAQLKKYPSQDVIDTKTDLTIQDQEDGSNTASYVYSIDDVKNGNYFAVFSITTKNLTAASDENSTETTTYPVPVRVVTNLTSESTEKLTDIRNVCVITYALGTDGTVSWKDGTTPERVYTKYQNVTLPTYEKLAPIETKIFNGWKVQGSTDSEPTSTMIITENVTLEPDWITTTLYVDGSATEAEHDALTESTAVQSLSAAVTKLVAYEKLDDGDDTSYQHEWTISVNRTCSGTSDLSSLKITKLTITGDNNTQDILDGTTGTGSVITNAGTYPLYIKNLTIQNGSNSAGGGLNITNTTAYLDNVILTGNTSTGNGGAIALTAAKLFIYGGCQIGQKSSEAVAATDTECSNRAGVSGGGIYADENSTIYFGYTAADETNVTMTAEGTPSNIISYNYAGTEGNGGGICCRGKLYINGGTISYNSADSNGGGISVSNETHLTGTTIIGNKATTNGGGIYVESGNSAILFLSGKTTIGASSVPSFATSTSNSNSAKNGGGIYLGSSTKAYLNYTSDGTIDASGIVNITYNYATAPASNEGGGGIHAEMNSELYIAPGTTINYNASNYNGGGIYGVESTTYMSGGTIYGNYAKYGGGIYLSGKDYGSGWIYYGTLYMYGDAKIGTSVNLIDDSYSNSALYGGGIYLADIYSKAYLGYSGINEENNLNGGVSYNKALATTYDGGGGIYNKGLLQVSSGSISNNISETNGGGIYSSGTLEISAATIKSNTADGSGGGIYTTNLSMKGSTVSNNAATGEGGAIYIEATQTTKSFITSVNLNGTISPTVISGNTSSSNGAGIFFTDGELYISGTTICDNKATSNGGGIYVGSGTSAKLFLFGATTIGVAPEELSFATSDNNSNSATNGGGIYLGSSTQAYLNYTSDGIIDESGAVNITYNYAKFGNNDYGGGGIYAENNSKLYIAKGTTINYNEGTKGGGIFGNGNTTYMSGGTIYGNDAKYGGGIYLAGTDEYKGTLYMYGEAKIGTLENLLYDSDNAIYYSNGAVYGGGIYIDVHSQAYLGYSGINEKNNLTGGVCFNCAFKATATATGVGGGVYNYGILWMSSGNISHNTSQNSGGGVYNLPNAEFTMTGGTIESNTAKNGGGVYNKGIFDVSSGNIKSNTVTENGGGIYTDPANSTDETVLENSEITENTAVNGGGVYIAVGHLDIKKATIFKENTATDKGGAIGGEETYYINIEDQGESAFAYIEPDSICNDIYLNKYSSINLNLSGNTLSPDHDYIARFTPYEYVDNVTYIGGGDAVSYKKFQVTPQKRTDGTEVVWETTSNGKIQEKQP